MVGDFPRYYGNFRVHVEGADTTSAYAALNELRADLDDYIPGTFPDIDEFATTAKNAMMPSLSDGDSLVNFLFELKDFKHLSKGILNRFWHRNATTRMGFAGIKDTLWDAFGQQPWNAKKRTPWRNWPNVYLSWKLAWEPFVNDCTSLLNKFLNFEKKIREFERRANQPQQRYYGKTFDVDPPGGSFSSDWTEWSDYGLYAVQRRTRKSEVSTNKVRLTATMRYNYVLPPELSSLGKALGAKLDVLGINGNPAIVWNAIPFSFVVDWFYNVGGYLEGLRFDNVRPITTISDMCVSQRTERNLVLAHQLALRPDDLDLMKVYPEKGVVCRRVSYKREVIDPAFIGVLSSGSGLVGTRAAVLTALGSVKLPTPGKVRRGPYNWARLLNDSNSRARKP